MKIKFTATENFKMYDDRPAWKDGDVREIEDDRADELLKSFPGIFSVAKKEAEAKPPPSKKSYFGKDKAVKGARNK